MLFLQAEGNSFVPAPSQPWTEDKASEDLGSVFFDSDNDGDLDLYVVSGGNEFELDDKRLQDRLYLNQGGGKFVKSEGLLPRMKSSGMRVVEGDFDGDCDVDGSDLNFFSSDLGTTDFFGS